MLRRLRQRSRGQSVLEYSVLLVLVMAAFLSMQIYFRRGLQGRWKTVADDLGDQYDPRFANTEVRHSLSGVTNTSIVTSSFTNSEGTFLFTQRLDNAQTTESKTGFESTMGF